MVTMQILNSILHLSCKVHRLLKIVWMLLTNHIFIVSLSLLYKNNIITNITLWFSPCVVPRSCTKSPNFFEHIYFASFTIAPLLTERDMQAFNEKLGCWLEMSCSIQGKQWLHDIFVTSDIVQGSKRSMASNHLGNSGQCPGYSSDQKWSDGGNECIYKYWNVELWIKITWCALVFTQYLFVKLQASKKSHFSEQK